MANVTIKDIADVCGVSYATVSRTLNRRSGVDPKTREKVQRVADRLGYSPNLHARSLKTNQTGIIGLILPDISNPFFADIASAVNKVIYAQGYNSILCTTGWDVEIEEKQLSVLLDHRVDGIIFKPSPELTERYANLPIAKVMISNAQDRRFNFVEIDNREGGRIAADHLSDCGYQAPAFIGGDEDSRSNRDRLWGFRERLKERRIELSDKMVRFGGFSIESGYQSVSTLLNQSDRPDCFFCGNDLIALGVLQFLSENRYPVPNSAGIVGFDDVYFSSLPQIQLTTIRQPRHEIGAYAAQALIAALENDDPRPTTHITLQPQLIARNTTIRQSSKQSQETP